MDERRTVPSAALLDAWETARKNTDEQLRKLQILSQTSAWQNAAGEMTTVTAFLNTWSARESAIGVQMATEFLRVTVDKAATDLNRTANEISTRVETSSAKLATAIDALTAENHDTGKRLANWTRALAFATLLLVVATLLLAYTAWVIGPPQTLVVPPK